MTRLNLILLGLPTERFRIGLLAKTLCAFLESPVLATYSVQQPCLMLCTFQKPNAVVFNKRLILQETKTFVDSGNTRISYLPSAC